MSTDEIQNRINAMTVAMAAKGLRRPIAEYVIRANEQPHVYLKWQGTKKRNDYGYSDEDYKFLRADTAAEALDAADDFIAALPSPEEAKHREFMAALGDVIDLGRANGIEVAYVNPLVETMKRLSENALTYQPAAAE